MKVSVVCPFYNESAIIRKAAEGMLKNLKATNYDWELIAVNDGSTDNSLELISEIFSTESRAKVVSYPYNKGRGHALKTGINAATKDFIVTTEIDLSWGDSIVEDIINKFIQEPWLDMVVASPHLQGGGYRNVPPYRVYLSDIGNIILRYLFTKKITMNTGMTRGYKREVIQPIDIDEKGKEFHLEVLLKMLSLGYRVGEIPATLEWKDHKLSAPGSKKRKSSSKTKKLIFSHLNFAVFANPIRYFWAFSILCFIVAFTFGCVSIYRLTQHEVAIYYGLLSGILGLFGLVFFGFGIVSAQNNKIVQELWKINIKMNS
jgi:dolichol-phosphate mannosyltransferase